MDNADNNIKSILRRAKEYARHASCESCGLNTLCRWDTERFRFSLKWCEQVFLRGLFAGIVDKDGRVIGKVNASNLSKMVTISTYARAFHHKHASKNCKSCPLFDECNVVRDVSCHSTYLAAVVSGRLDLVPHPGEYVQFKEV